MKRAIRIGAGGLLLSTLAAVAVAQAPRSGGDVSRSGAQAQALQMQLQQVSAERASLRVENEQLKKDLDKARRDASQLKSERGALQRRAESADASVRRLSSVNESTGESMDRLRGQQDELIGKFRQTVQTLANVEGDRNKAFAELQQKKRELTTCIETNVQMHQINSEVLTRLEDRGIFGALLEREPFTRVTRARLENLVDDARYRAAELKLKFPAATAPAK
jgi:chromosome segregation ATPase